MRYIFLLFLFTCAAVAQPYWMPLNNPDFAYDPRDIAIANNGVMYTIGGPNRELVKSTNQGDSWALLATSEDSVCAVGVQPDNDQVILIGLLSSEVKRSTDGGSSWTTVISAGTMAARANRIAFNPNKPDTVLIGTIGNATGYHMYRSLNSGSTFSQVGAFGAKTTVTDIYWPPQCVDTVLVTGADLGTENSEGVWRGHNGGANWTQKNTGLGTNMNIASITVDPNNRYTLYCVRYDGQFKMFKSTTQAISWDSLVPGDRTPGGRKIIAHSSTNILVATTKGMWQTTNSGTAWGAISTTGLYDNELKWMAKYSSGGTTYYYVGAFGSFFRSTDVGVNWTEKVSGMTTMPFSSVAIQSSSTIFALPTTGYVKTLLQRTTNSGTDWTNVLSYTDGASTAWESRDVATNSSYVVVSGRKTGSTGPVILVSTNSGSGWQRVLTPAGNGTANKIGLDPNNSATFYVAAQNTSQSPTGGVYKTTDGGQNWSWKGITDGEFTCVIVDPNNSNNLYAGGINLGVYKSTDAGNTWNPARTGLGTVTVNTLAINPTTGLSDTLYAGTAAYGVYRSVDAAANWTQLTSATPSTSSNVSNLLTHPENTSVLYASGVDASTQFLVKIGLASSTATDRDEQGGMTPGNTVNKVITNPFVKYKLLAATSDGIYTKIHQWEGKIEYNLTWASTDTIQIGYWDPEEGMHDGTLTVPQGKTLTINPGTTVRFMAPDDGLTAGAELSVLGVLNAQGLSNNKIYFQPYDVTKLGAWVGISQTGTGTLTYCEFLRMDVGVYYSFTSTPGTISHCTFTDVTSYGLGFYDVTLGSPAVVAKHIRVLGTNTDPYAGMYFRNTNVGIDSSYITGCERGIWIEKGTPGFRVDTVENNGTGSGSVQIGGVICEMYGNPDYASSASLSPKFGGYLGTEAGYNVIRNNYPYEVYADSADPFFGSASSGGGNKIYDDGGGVRIRAINNSAVLAQNNYWSGECPPPSGWFETATNSTIDYSNCLTFAPPTLVNPLNNMTGLSNSYITLQWNNYPGASSYALQVAHDSLFTSLALNVGSTCCSLYFFSTNLAAGTKYYWRVKATAGLETPWSAVWNFTSCEDVCSAPTISAPTNGATGVVRNPLFTWNSLGGAVNYRLQVSTNLAFSNIIRDITQAGTSYTYAQPYLNSNTKYYARAKGKDDEGIEGPWSVVDSFTTGTSLPPPTMVSPVSGTGGFVNYVDLHWNNYSGATSYALQVAYDTGFTNLALNIGSTCCSLYFYSSGIFMRTRYYWRVKATLDVQTPWSSAWNFSTLCDTCDVPTIINPHDDTTGYCMNPTITWTTTDEAASYRAQVSANSNFTNIVRDEITANTNYTFTALSANTEYFTRVKGLDSDGIEMPWSSVVSFTTGDFTCGSKISIDEETPIPDYYQLSQNHPNPFNPTTEIRYDLPEDQFVTLKVFDMLGREVMTLANEHQSAGYKVARFDASTLPSGVYIYRIQAGTFSDIKKMVLTK